MATEDFVQNILSRDDGEIIARLAQQSNRNLLGGLQDVLSECGIILGEKAMVELYIICKWRHFVIALRREMVVESLSLPSGATK